MDRSAHDSALFACEKLYRTGTHRRRHPSETVQTLRPLMPTLGITRIADLTGLDCIGLPVVQVVRPNSRSLSVSQGKGVEFDAAVASGLMETIEHWHAEHIDLPLRHCSFEELRVGQRVVDVTPLARIRNGRFHSHLKTLWVEGVDLVDGLPRWVPYECVTLDFRLPMGPGAGSFHMSSNGLAGGNTLLEATAHGLCELVERDATTLWLAADRPAQDEQRVNLDTVEDSLNRHVLSLYERAGLEVGVWDTTSDIGLPSYRASVIDRSASGRTLGSFGGFGCHLDRTIALSRALTEAAQSRLTRIAATRDNRIFDTFERYQGTDRGADYRARLQRHRGTRSINDAPTYSFSSFAEDVEFIVERLVACGLRQIVRVDLTKPDVGVPVVCMIVPGLETNHDHPAFLPGRRAAAITRAHP